MLSIHCRRRPVCLLVALLLLAPRGGLVAQAPAEGGWSLRLAGALSGGSHASAPAGFRVYSGIAIEAGAERRFGRHLALLATLRTESREMDSVPAAGARLRLGSVEFLALTTQVRYRPAWRGRMRPVVGVGAGLLVAWEESGTLDTLDVTPSVGPMLELGLERDLTAAATLLIGARSERHRPHLTRGNDRLARLDLDPLTLLAGLTLRF